jgi:hypothetical protein
VTASNNPWYRNRVRATNPWKAAALPCSPCSPSA